MAKILVADGMDKTAADSLKQMGHELTEEHFDTEELKVQIKKHDAVIVRSATKITKEIIDAALETKQLKLVIRAGVGVDNIDVGYAKENGIQVNNTPAASSAAVAELAIGHMFVVSRHLHMANVTMRQGQWNKKQYTGIELGGKTLGLIGFGRIAQETAKRALALGMSVIYYDCLGANANCKDCGYVTLDELLAQSDFISLHIPFDKSQGALISKKEFDIMKDSAYLINCARGGVVDENAMLDALDSGKLAGAAIDVFEEEPTKNERLYTHPKVSLTPHIGASTVEAQERIGGEIVSIVRDNLA